MDIDLINAFIKNLFIIVAVIYTTNKLINFKVKNRKIIIVHIVGAFVFGIFYIILKQKLNIFLALLIIYILLNFYLSKIMKRKLLLVILIAFALNMIFWLISLSLTFLVINMIGLNLEMLNVFIMSFIQILLNILFFKIKRFSNGFEFLKKQNELTDLIMFNIGIIIAVIYIIPGLISVNNEEEAGKNFFLSFIPFCIFMFIIIQKTLVLSYKQKQLERTVKEYEDEIKEKDKIIERKTEENFRYNKLNHEFYGRLKSLEITVEDLLKENKFNSEIGEELALDINNLTKEYSNKQKDSKDLDKLPKTEILEIDNMFHYMQTEAAKKNIDFNLQITGNIYYMINNIIPKNLLVTLIGDHLKDAIIAVDSSNNNYKNILAILGINNDIYELCIYDSGIEFDIDTLLNLGLKPVTTHKDTGGTGIGFITTFETLNKTKASLIIEEKHPMTDTDYTKAVRIRFDNKNEYKIISYRAEEIKKKIKVDRITVENL